MNERSRPGFKPIFFVHSLKQGTVRTGDFFPNQALELEDDNGSVRALIDLLDGRRTIAELSEEMRRMYPAVERADVVSAVAELQRLGLVEDMALEEQSSLTARELERFKANLNYFSYFSNERTSRWGLQERLKSARITIIGAGAFGSNVLFSLAGLGVSSVRIVDFDTVDLSNLNRQMLFNEKDIGRPKVDVAKEFMAKFHSGMQVEALHAELRSAADVDRIVDGSDLVMLAADQPIYLMQRWVNEACVRRGIPFVSGGVSAVGGLLCTVIPGVTGCIDCAHAKESARHPDYVRLVANVLRSRYAMPNTATAANLMMICGMIAADMVRLVTGVGPVRSQGRMVAFDFATFEACDFLDFSKSEVQCPTCGGGSGEEPIFRAFAELERELAAANAQTIEAAAQSQGGAHGR